MFIWYALSYFCPSILSFSSEHIQKFYPGIVYIHLRIIVPRVQLQLNQEPYFREHLLKFSMLRVFLTNIKFIKV